MAQQVGPLLGHLYVWPDGHTGILFWQKIGTVPLEEELDDEEPPEEELEPPEEEAPLEEGV